MKKVIMLVAMLMVTWVSYAQKIETKNDGQSFPDFVHHTFKDLNLKPATSGYLMDAALQLAPFQLYKGKYVADSLDMDINKFGSLYAMLTMAQTKADQLLPDPKLLYNYKPTKGPMPIVLLLQQYNYIKSDAIDKGYIAVKDKQFLGLKPDMNEAFGTDTLFAATTIQNFTTTKDCQFVLPAANFLNNLGKIKSIAFQTDQESKAQTIVLDEPFTPKFNKSGKQKATISVTLADGRVLRCRFIFTVPNLELIGERGGPDDDYKKVTDPNFTEVINFTADKGYAGHDGFQFGNADITIFYACPGKKLRKPLIMVDGFNTFVGVNQTTAQSSLTFFGQFKNTPLSTNTNPRKLSQEYRKEGYDLIFVDWLSGDGRDYMQRSAYCLQKIIQFVNAKKAENGSDEKNVLIGYSMGGPICKYALRDLEKQGIAHQTSKFIAYDGAMQGANIPLGFQYMLKDIGDMDVTVNVPLIGINVFNYGKLRTFVPILGNNYDLLESPSARQLLEYQAKPFGNNQIVSSDFTNFYNELNALGNLQNCEYLAVSNGSVVGDSDFPFGQLLVGVDTGTPNVFPLNLLLLNIELEVKVNALPNPNNTALSIVYKRGINVSGLGGLIAVNGNSSSYPYEVKVSGYKPLDNAPGGITEIIGDSEIPSFIPKAVFGRYADGDQEPFHPCFIPTVSGFDLKKPALNNVFFDVSFPPTVEGNSRGAVRPIGSHGIVVRDDGEKGRSSIDPLLGQGNKELKRIKNQAHVAISFRTSAYFIYELTDHNALASSTNVTLNNRTYNFGRNADTLNFVDFFQRETHNTIDYQLDVSGVGQVWVNRKEKIGFTDQVNNPENLGSNQYYTLFIKETNICSGNSRVVVRDNGEFNVGETHPVYYKSEVIIKRRGSLIVKEGGHLNVYPNSKIRVQKDGILEINRGELHLYENAQIYVEDGGTMIVSGDSENIIDNLSQIIVEKGGKLIINNGPERARFVGNGVNSSVLIKGELQVNAPIKMNGTAFFDFAKDHKVTLLSTFDLLGDGKAKMMVNLQQYTTLNLKNQDVVFANGGIFYAGSTKIEMPSRKTVQFDNVNFEAITNKLNWITGLTNQNRVSPTNISINGCTFHNLSRDIELAHNDISESPSSFYISGSVFDYKEFGILLEKSFRMNAVNSSFFPGLTTGGQGFGELGLIVQPSSPVAIIAIDVPLIIDLSGCEINGTRDPSYNSAEIFKINYDVAMNDPATIDDTHACKLIPQLYNNGPFDLKQGFGYAIYLQNVPQFYLNNGTNIHDASIPSPEAKYIKKANM